MIVFKREDSFIMITQHDHAQISGIIARSWKNNYFPITERKEEVILAIREHDSGWIEADTSPIWNNQKEKPYSFTDYPIDSKTVIYKKGIDKVERMSKYASLLCSLHYVSFLQDEVHPAAKQFVADERMRLQYLFKALGINGKREIEDLFMYHLKILKFCDNLSLYICLNEPGIKKENEHPYFRHGFPEEFPFANNKRIHANWANQETVVLTVSPLCKELQVFLSYKEVKKEEIMRKGLVKAYTDTPTSIRIVKFI
jgi:hypothetical protein